MRKFSSPLPEHLYEPANYPVFRQVLIVGMGLLLIFSGVLLSDDAPEREKNQAATATPDSTPTEPQDLSTAPPIIHDDLELEATAAHVYDVRTGQTMYSKNETDVLPLASITKLMTVLVVAELLEDGAVITVTDDAVAQYGSSGLRVGERITKENLSAYALLSSSNDAAYALADSVGDELFPGEGAEAFIDAMNVRAEEIGLSNTSFQNPTGLDVTTVESGANGSAQDVTKLMQYLLEQHPDVLATTKDDRRNIYNEAGDSHEAANTNRIVERIPGVLGSKTGFTDLAGGNLTIAFDAGFDRPVIITVLGSSFAGRFRDVERLLEATQLTWHQTDA